MYAGWPCSRVDSERLHEIPADFATAVASSPPRLSQVVNPDRSATVLAFARQVAYRSIEF